MFRCNHCEQYRDKSECCEDPTSDYGNICEECADAYACEIEGVKTINHQEIYKKNLANSVSAAIRAAKDFLSFVQSVDESIQDKAYSSLTHYAIMTYIISSRIESVANELTKDINMLSSSMINEYMVAEAKKNETLENNNGL